MKTAMPRPAGTFFYQYKSTLLASATTSKRPKKAKSVCFDQNDDMVEIKHVDDFSREEIDELQWPPQEQCDIRMPCVNLVGRFHAGVMDKEEMLGLEKAAHQGCCRASQDTAVLSTKIS